MNDLMKLALSLSLSGSLLILLLLLARPLFRGRASRAVQYYLWLLVIARLLLPLTPQASLMGALFAQFEKNADYVDREKNALQDAENSNLPGYGCPAEYTEVPAGQGADTPGTPDFSPQESLPSAGQEPAFSSEVNAGQTPLHRIADALLQNLWLIWLAVALALLVRKITACQSFTKYVKAGCREVSDTALLDSLAQICMRSGVKRPVELYENPLVPSPMLLGFLRPCIVLPCAGLPEQDFRHIIMHELVHYKRRDLLYKWLVQITACLHWFNPLIRIMDREICRACELSCDEAVLRSLPERERHSYGDTLMHALGCCPGIFSPAAPASVTLGESAKLLKERLNAILCFQPRLRWNVRISLLLAAILAGGFTVSGAYRNLPDSSQPGSARIFEPENIPDSSDDVFPEAGSRPAIGQDTDGALSKSGPAFSGKVYTYTYRQDGFYQAPYLFTLGWNLLGRDLKHYESMSLSLSDNSNITLLLEDSCRDFPMDADACQSLSSLLLKLKADMVDTEYPLTLPLLINVRNTGDSTPLELAGQLYQNDLIGFSAVYPLLEEAEQKRFLDRAFSDSAVSFYGCCLNHINADGDTLNRFAEKACADNQIALFGVTLNYLEPDSSLISQYAQKAYSENNIAIFNVCLNSLASDNPVMGQLAEDAYENDNAAFFSCLACHMEQDTLDYWTARAIEDKKSQLLSALLANAHRDDDKD